MVAGIRVGLLLVVLLGTVSLRGAELADTPNPWFWLARYDRTLTRAEFEQGLGLFDPAGAVKSFCDIDDAGATFYPSATERRAPQFHIAFAPADAPGAPFPRTYRSPAEFRALKKPEGKPLAGLRVAIDPGHIGGAWGQVEDRSITYPGIGRIQEGDMNLVTAAILEKNLAALGAEVYPTRRAPEPVTPVRPEQLRPEAEALLRQLHPGTRSFPPARIDLMTHLLFERKYEFIARGEEIRREFPAPDVTVVLYINATPSSGRAQLVGVNQNIFFVEGAYTKDEIALDDQRERMTYKILDRVAPVEYEVAAAIARAFTDTTGLPPVGYGNSPTTRLIDPDNFYVVARNLGANRQYDGPVVTTEPYFMNHRTTALRLVAGDYDGERTFAGDAKAYPSLFREYADCVLRGLVAAYGPPAPTPAPAPTPTPPAAPAPTSEL